MGRLKVSRAEYAGACYGVQRALDLTLETANADKTVCTLGPLIHNPQVVSDLAARGIRVADAVEDCTEQAVVIRSHGVVPEVLDALAARGNEIVDATCPFVKKIHRIVQEQNLQGRRVIIIGDETHPEVEGIKGWGDARTMVVKNEEQMEKLPSFTGEKLCIVSQTTFNYNKFKDLVEKFEKKGYDILVLNTICNATQERQVEAERIASQVDAMIVIGGKNSSNTRKLYEICQKECKDTYYIQTLDDLNPESVNSVRSVGITAGASTPKKIIEEVHTNVRIKF